MNYFELFGLKPDYTVDLASVSKTYRELQMQFHPDKFATASQSDKLAAMQKASQINDAFQTLKSPLRRAEYLLSLAGVDLQHEQQTLRDPAFLMQQMEWREQLEEIAQSRDPDSEISAFAKQLACHQDTLQQQLVTTLAAQSYQDAALLVRKLKFMFKLQQELELLEESLLE
ncbi:co-chaperone HscB [Motilimonas eburnea]|uniref:co-chaperone HscB n=1 Tax=Motilimonas eburnea TaxID=1737488 RepID=UPI001E473E8B|nr:co-chaperone HscB [Motilimonas eburnea]